MLTLTRRLPGDTHAAVDFNLPLTAEERTRSRHTFTSNGQTFHLRLPRGTILRDGDLLQTESGDSSELPLHQVRIIAKPEPVLTVTAHTPLELLRAAYHLGNRHVPLEVAPTYLRLSPDSVLQDMLHKMGLHVTQEVLPFQPEGGAYEPVHEHGHS